MLLRRSKIACAAARERAAMATDIVKVGRALHLRFRQGGPRRSRARARRTRRRAPLDRRHGGGAERRRPRGRRRRADHRLSRDDGRAGQDAAPAGAWRPARDPLRAGASGGDDRQRHRADRPSGRQPLSVRGDAEARRLVRGADREHRHRRPGDDPRRGQEPRRRRRDRRRRRLSRADRRTCSGTTGATSLAFRRRMAQKAFARTAAYDAAISNWLARGGSRARAEMARLRRRAAPELRRAALRRESASARGAVPDRRDAPRRRDRAPGPGQGAVLQQHQRHRRGL